MLRAKMICESVSKDQFGNENVSFHPVYEGSEENKRWSEFTPAGSLELTISAKGAQGKIQQGKEYFVDIAEASEG